MTKKSLNLRHRIYIGVLMCVAGVPVAKGDFLRDGRDAFMHYDFEQASENYEKYAKTLKKTPNAPGEAQLEKYLRQLEIAENALDNVQKIEIIDRIDVPASDFFAYIKLPTAGGQLVDRNVAVLNKRNNQSDFAFRSESNDFMMWSENNENHQEVLMQSERLMDGSWEKPTQAGSILNDGGNARNPFLLSDGVTLYYSSNGEGSMGGYDLFVATKDPVSGEYRQPIGLGYPFNSPFNEYMMAIDEANGIGWWVTDRNLIDGQVSVYIFKTNEVRKNYNPDEEDIIPLARVDDISITQNPDTDYNAIIKSINERSESAKSKENVDFFFPLPGGRIAKNMSDFISGAAKRDMKQYLGAQKEHVELEKKLADLRKQYHNSDKIKGSATTLRNQILDLEAKRDWQQDRLKKMRNSIISSETKQ